MTVPELNEILSRELHRNPYGAGIYAWEWSEDLYWPSYATGGRVEKRSPGGIVYFEKEYRRDRMTSKLRNQWVVTKWCAPETLGHWQVNFPGADYPHKGYRINTDWYNKPGIMPSHEDTIRLIWAIRKQTGMSATELNNEQDAERERGQKERDSVVEDEIRDSFTAFLNDPGKRSGHVSLPYSKQEREEALPHG